MYKFVYMYVRMYRLCSCSYFTDGLKTIEHFKCYIEELVVKLGSIKQRQDRERKRLVELRDTLKANVATYKEVSIIKNRFYDRAL